MDFFFSGMKLSWDKLIFMRYLPRVRSRWLDIGQVLFFAFLWTETKNEKIEEKIALLLGLSGRATGNPERAR